MFACANYELQLLIESGIRSIGTSVIFIKFGMSLPLILLASSLSDNVADDRQPCKRNKTQNEIDCRD